MNVQAFSAIDRLYGLGSAETLSRMHVAVIGVGGVGSWVVECLARSGVGQITMIDGDDVCASNANRQIQAIEGCYGRPKVEVLAERVRAINASLHVHACSSFLTTQNLSALLLPSFDYVIDACDAFRVKIEAIYYCRRNKIPILTVGAAGGRVDPQKITMRDLAKTENDILLGMVRRKLRDERGWTRNPKRYFGVPAVYSMENVRYADAHGAIVCAKPDQTESLRLDCTQGLGVVMHVTTSFAMLAVSTVIDRLFAKARGERPR